MVQEAVQQDKVEAGGASSKWAACVDDGEVFPVSRAGVSQIIVVAVHTDVPRMSERGRVRTGAAPDVEHAEGTSEVVVPADGSELLPGIGRLPDAINGRTLHDRGQDAQGSTPNTGRVTARPTDHVHAVPSCRRDRR